MARRRTGKNRAKKAAKKKVVRKKAARKKAVGKKAAKRSTSRRSPRRAGSSAGGPARRFGAGVITHTELASANPPATRTWCETVLGWKFGEPTPTPAGPYHMWRFEGGTGGGIRANNPPEVPGSIPYCEVADIRATYAAALGGGATEMLAPQELPGGMGWIAIVTAPGGVAIGFWGPK